MAGARLDVSLKISEPLKHALALALDLSERQISHDLGLQTAWQSTFEQSHTSTPRQNSGATPVSPQAGHRVGKSPGASDSRYARVDRNAGCIRAGWQQVGGEPPAQTTSGLEGELAIVIPSKPLAANTFQRFSINGFSAQRRETVGLSLT